jgi:RNAse (barnase) inhibitor barstar
MNASGSFIFVSNVQHFSASDAFVARIENPLYTAQQLFELLYQLLALPGYFGFNWNALFDCLRDFHWIDQKTIVIVHDQLPEIPSLDLRTYFEILRDAIIDWKPGDQHSLQVVFDEKDRIRVEAVMTGG